MAKKPKQKLILDDSKLKEEWSQLPKQSKEADRGVQPKSTKRP